MYDVWTVETETQPAVKSEIKNSKNCWQSVRRWYDVNNKSDKTDRVQMWVESCHLVKNYGEDFSREGA